MSNRDLTTTELQTVFDQAPALIGLVGPDDHYVLVNGAYSKFFEIPVENICGAHISDVLGQGVYDRIKPNIEKAQNGEATRHDINVPQKDGTKRWLEVRYVPHFEDDGKVNGFFVLVVDIHDRKMAQDELEQTNKQLMTFAYIASHDLQEPLRKIQQFGALLAKRYQTEIDEKGQHFINTMINSARHMGGLVEDLLSYIKTSKPDVIKNEIVLSSLIKEVIVELEDLVIETGGYITFENLPDVVGDKSMLRQLFVNLISNGLKYQAEGQRPRIEIKFEERNSEGVSELQVHDNGIGFEMKYHGQIFEPFKRLHSKDTYPGTGIGLAICKNVCDRHNWVISAQSELGKGSVFSIKMTHSPLGEDQEPFSDKDLVLGTDYSI